VYERAVYWSQWGHRVTVITSAPNFPQGRVYDGYSNRWHQVEEMSGIRVVRVKTFIAPNSGVGRRTLDFASYMVTAFITSIFEDAPDVVVSTSPQILAAVAGVASAAVKGRPHVFELGDLWPASIAELGAINTGLRALEKLELTLYARSAAVVSLTRAFKDNLMARGVHADKIAVVMNGAELSRWQPGTKDISIQKSLGLEGKTVFSYMGTQGLAHGLENVLHAADLLRGRDDIRFVFVGTGAAHAGLIEEAERRQLGNVLFVPPQPKSAIANYWKLSDVAMVHLKGIPVMRTVIPSKTFEAMCFGLPILLVAPSGEITRLVKQTGSGVVVEPANPAALAAAVTHLADDRALRAELARKSLGSAPRFSREQQARDMLAVLKAVVERQPIAKHLL